MLNSTKPTLGVISAEPEPIRLDWPATALLIIDMQFNGGIGYGPDEKVAGGRVGLRVGW